MNLGKFNMKHPDGSVLNYRKCFAPPPGWLMCSADFSGQELSVMAVLSGDPIMIKTIRENGDLHSEAAAGMFNLDLSKDPNAARQPIPGLQGVTYRDRGKVMMFSLAYGKSADGFAKDWKIDKKEAEEIVKNFEKKFHVLASWLKRHGELGAAQGYSRLVNGAMRFVNDSAKGDRSAPKRASANYQIQGISSWMTRLAMILIDKRIRDEGLNMQLTGCVHDELLAIFKYHDGCPYSKYCRHQDEITNELNKRMKQAKADKDKAVEKECEKLLEQRKVFLQESCATACCDEKDCATRYEAIIGECMEAAGDHILKGVVRTNYSAGTWEYWAH